MGVLNGRSMTNPRRRISASSISFVSASVMPGCAESHANAPRMMAVSRAAASLWSCISRGFHICEALEFFCRSHRDVAVPRIEHDLGMAGNRNDDISGPFKLRRRGWARVDVVRSEDAHDARVRPEVGLHFHDYSRGLR